jgi:hypothetical protein
LESSKITNQIITDENLFMPGMGFAILDFYVIAEWQILGGLLIVFSGYGIIIATTKIAEKAF